MIAGRVHLGTKCKSGVQNSVFYIWERGIQNSANDEMCEELRACRPRTDTIPSPLADVQAISGMIPVKFAETMQRMIQRGFARESSARSGSGPEDPSAER